MVNVLSNFLSRQNQGIGIEINPDKINLIQLAKKGQQYRLLKYHSIDVPEEIFEEGQIADSPALAELIEELLEEAKVKPTKIATALPMREAIIRIIPIPAELNDADLRDMVLNHEAPLYLPYPREEVDLDYKKLGYFIDDDGIEKVQVLLVATRREVTDLYVEVFQQIGLKINVLDINSFALIRAIREQLKQFSSSEAVVLVDIEFDSTEIAIIVDGVPQFSRTVPIGTYQMQSALAQAMNLPISKNTELLQEITLLDNPEGTTGTTTTTASSQTWINPGLDSLLKVLGELIDEVRRSINFYLNQTGDVEVVQLFLAGPGSGLAQLDELFTKKLSLPTMQVDPLSILGIKPNEELSLSPMERGSLGTVLGLGMRMI
jgi:type IV pilus assembly protein PilM